MNAIFLFVNNVILFYFTTEFTEIF